MNGHLYPLSSIKIILHLALKNINFKTHNLIAQTAKEEALAKLRGIIKEHAHFLSPLSDDPSKRIEKDITDYNNANPGMAIGDHEWAVLCKEAVQNGCILDRKDFEVYSAWDTFLNKLKENYPQANPDVCAAFLVFMKQLLNSNQIDSVQVIHDFLHIIQKVAENLDPQHMKEKGLLALVGCCLWDGLEFGGKELLDDNVSKEYQFFSKVLLLLSLKKFSNTFQSRDYDHIDVTYEVQKHDRDLQRFLWTDLPQSGVSLEDLKQFLIEKKQERATPEKKKKKKTGGLSELFTKLSISKKSSPPQPSSAPVSQSVPLLSSVSISSDKMDDEEELDEMAAAKQDLLNELKNRQRSLSETIKRPRTMTPRYNTSKIQYGALAASSASDSSEESPKKKEKPQT